MSDTLEQARAKAISRVCDCEATTPYGHSTERCRQAGIDAIDALIAAVRAESSAAVDEAIQAWNKENELRHDAEEAVAEAQREAFEAGWDAGFEANDEWVPAEIDNCADAFAAYLTRQAGQRR